MATKRKIFAYLFLLTGIFALVSSLYTWGKGPLWSQRELIQAWLPWADLILTVPLSFLTAFALFAPKRYAPSLGLITSGVYLLGSVMVYIEVLWKGPPCPLPLLIPPIFGIGIALFFFFWTLEKTREGDKREVENLIPKLEEAERIKKNEYIESLVTTKEK